MKESATSENYEKVYGSDLNDFIEFEKVRPWANLPDFYHFVTLLLICAVSILKLGMLMDSILFKTTDAMRVMFSNGVVFDSQEVLSHSPRFLGIYTMCFMGRARFTAKKDTWCAV